MSLRNSHWLSRAPIQQLNCPQSRYPRNSRLDNYFALLKYPKTPAKRDKLRHQAESGTVFQPLKQTQKRVRSGFKISKNHRSRSKRIRAPAQQRDWPE